MPSNLFLQNTIAVIWDFDKTLTPGYMQDPLFNKFGVDGKEFWNEVNELPAFHQQNGLTAVSKDLMYLNHILSFVRHGKFPNLNNKMLRELGKEIEFYGGLPDFFERAKAYVYGNPEYHRFEIHVGHYIISTGLRQMIMGSNIAPFVEGVWACEFIEQSAEPGYRNSVKQPRLVEDGVVISEVGYFIDNTTKTRAIFEINKGANKLNIDVNSSIPQEERRVPFQNMIYIADGPSDIPVFSILNQYGGNTFAVYKRGAIGEFRQVYDLQRQGRVKSFGEADYTEESQTSMWILESIRRIADRIVQDRRRALDERVGSPPRHITEESHVKRVSAMDDSR